MRCFRFLYLFLILILFSNCVVIKEMIPTLPSSSIDPFDLNLVDRANYLSLDDIGLEYFYVDGYNESHTPPNITPTQKLSDFLIETQGTTNLNRSGIIRIYNKNKVSKNILIMSPGIYSGGGTQTNLGYAIVRRDIDTEVWIWERRANQLEDRRKFIKAIKENDPNIIYNLLEDGKLKLKKDSYYQPSTEDISFVGYWGLNVQLGDLYNIVKLAKTKVECVILTGYSLGVSYVTNFLGNNFGTNDQFEAGYTLVDKVILFDGPPSIDSYVKKEDDYKNGVTIFPNNYFDGIDKLESGNYYPANANGTRNMDSFYLMDVKAVLAKLAPYDLSYEDYKSGAKSFKITNYAKYLIGIDDNYNFFKLFTTTFGRADAKHIGSFNYTDTVSIVDYSQGKDRIEWIDRRENDTNEFNSPKSYIDNATNLAFNMAEWYQPTRILLDFGSVHLNDTSNGWQKKYFNVTQTKYIDNSILTIGLSRGLVQNSSIYLKYKNRINSKDFTIIMVNGMTHSDGDSVSDNGGRQFLADIVANWLLSKPIIGK